MNFERLTGSVKVQTISRSVTLRTSMRLDLTVATCVLSGERRQFGEAVEGM